MAKLSEHIFLCLLHGKLGSFCFCWLFMMKLEGNGPIDERATVVEVSVTNLNFIFEISNLNYPGIYVHITSNCHFGGL